MKKFDILIAALALLFCTSTMAQDRYIDEVFSTYDSDTTIVYGTNATVLYYSVLNEAIPENLVMDVYTPPSSDTETERPLVIYAHTGNFIPFPDNGSASGTRRDSTCVEMCRRLAKRGYVVASIDYRLGWNPISPDQDERVNTLINAAYRGVQDARTCIRYFKKSFAENGNPYGVDTSKIVLWGQGTGGYITLATASLDRYSEVLLPKFTTVDGSGNPLPMVIEQVNGNIFGTSYGVNPLDGDTLCYPNHPGYSSEFQLCVNTGGAVGDSSWIEPGEVPHISFQAPTDPFAPYEEAVLIVPNVNLAVVEVQGAYIVQTLANQFGNNDVFANAGLSDVYTTEANTKNDGLDGLYPIVRPAGSETDSSPWDFWAASNPNNANGLVTNPDMSAAKAYAYMDTIIGYFAPRACLALGLGCTGVSVEQLTEEQVDLAVSPIPATDMVSIRTGANHLMEAVEIYNLNGVKVQSYEGLRTNSMTIERENLPTGMYIARVRVKDGVVTKKILFR